MKVALVTGSNSGIGYGCALDLARKGYKVYAGMRTPAKGEALIRVAAGEALALEPLQLDVNDAASMTRAVQRVLAVDGQIDVLVNNAGIPGGAPLELVSDELLRGIMETNFFGAYKMMQLVVPGMRERRSGAIINISSVAGILPNAIQSAYCASKFALEGASHALAGEVAQFNIRVVCVQPGFVETSILENAPQIDPALLQAPFPYHRQLRRLFKFFEIVRKKPAYPQDVADTVWRALTEDDYAQEYLVGRDAEALGRIARTLTRREMAQISSVEEDDQYFAALRERGVPV